MNPATAIPGSIKPSLLDRAIAYINPAAGMKRMQIKNFAGQLYEAANYSPNRSWIPIQPFDAKRTATSYTRLTMLSYARYLYANLGWPRGAINDLRRYSVGPRGLVPQSNSADKDWGKKAEDYFNEWCKIADDTGRFTFGDLQRMAVLCCAVDGDCGLVLTKTSSGFPKLRFIEGHQIKDDGTMINSVDGVIVDDYNAPNGYRILIPQQDGRLVSETVDPSNFIHFFDPERYTGTRGVSWLAHAINNGRDIFDLISYEKQFLHNACSVTLLERNDTGSADAAFTWINNPPTEVQNDGTNPGTDLKMEEMAGGTKQYFRANSGNGLEAFQFDRPTAAFREFMDYLEGDGYVGLGFPCNWKNLHKEGGATLRAALVKAQRRFDEVEVLVENRICDRTWNWVTAVGAKRGDLPSRPVDAHKVRWHGPSKATVDVGREATANRDDIKMGLRTYAEDFAERGLDWRSELQQVGLEEAFISQLAKTVKEPRENIQTRNPNAPLPGENSITV